MIQDKYICQFKFLPNGFKFKFIESVDDDGHELPLEALRSMQKNKIFSKDPGANKDASQTRANQQEIDEWKEEKERIIDELEDIPNVVNYMQLVNIANDYKSNF